MSFDIYLKGFTAGEASNVDGKAVARILDPLVIERSHGFARIQTADGQADVYGYDDPSTGLMVNHASGNEIWIVLANLASEVGFAIMPTGCGVCIPSPSLTQDLPEHLQQDATIVQSGPELWAAIVA